MAKHHWISVTDREQVPLQTLEELLTESHRLVAEKLSLETRKTLGISIT